MALPLLNDNTSVKDTFTIALADDSDNDDQCSSSSDVSISKKFFC